MQAIVLCYIYVLFMVLCCSMLNLMFVIIKYIDCYIGFLSFNDTIAKRIPDNYILNDLYIQFSENIKCLMFSDFTNVVG